MLIDTHTHLNFKVFTDTWREVVQAALATGVEKMIVVGTDVKTSQRAVEMADEHPALYAAVGIHPHHVKQFSITNYQLPMDEQLEEIANLAKHPRVVAIGEIGLDKHDYKNSRYELQASSAEMEKLFEIQKDLLRKQVDLAKMLDKPVILHSRDLRDEVLSLVEGKGIRGVFHCFEGSRKYLKRIIAAGFYLSFTGNITFIPDRSSVAFDAPLDRLLLETDSPYMTPEPLRGVQNTPSNVQLIAEHHATSRDLPLEAISEATSRNARHLFSLE